MNNWQSWITNNFDIIEYWARRWHWTEWRELVQHFSIYLQTNWSKFNKIPDDDERIKWMNAWFKNNVKWRNSDFNKSIAVNNNDDYIPDIGFEPTFELLDDDRDYKIDIMELYSEQQVEKLICVRLVYKGLKPTQQILFDLYFTRMMSIRQIATSIGIPSSSVYNLLQELKNEIKEKC